MKKYNQIAWPQHKISILQTLTAAISGLIGVNFELIRDVVVATDIAGSTSEKEEFSIKNKARE